MFDNIAFLCKLCSERQHLVRSCIKLITVRLLTLVKLSHIFKKFDKLQIKLRNSTEAQRSQGEGYPGAYHYDEVCFQPSRGEILQKQKRSLGGRL